MYYHFEILNQTRNNMLKAIEGLSMEELNKIPAGFNNNIAWNFNHAVMVMEILCYRLSGLDIKISDEYIQKYSKGTCPELTVSQDEMNFFIRLAKTNAAKLEAHYDKGVFDDYKIYKTSYNVTLTSIEEAIVFNNVHEGLHFGYIMALKRALGK